MKYAVAVREQDELLLFLRISRDPHGDVYVNFPRDYDPQWNPHASYHASGQHHQKSFNHKALVRHDQKPDENFVGTRNVVTTGIAAHEPRAINLICEPTAFDDVFEIPATALKPDTYKTLLSVDVIEPGCAPIITPGATILHDYTFNGRHPWILVTLFDTSSCPIVQAGE